MARAVRFSWLLCVALLVGGCVPRGVPPNVSLSPQTKRSIRTVAIKAEVLMPTTSQMWRPPSVRQVTSDFDRVVRTAFEEQLKKAGLFRAILEDGADAVFTLTIWRISLDVATGICGGLLKDCYTPTIWVQGTLQSWDGEILWRKMATVDITESEVPKHALSEYDQQRSLLRQDFMTAAQVAVEHLVADVGTSGR